MAADPTAHPPAPAAARPRLVAVDVDGTLINSAKAITPFTRAEVARVVAEGAHLVIATARSLDASLIIEQKLGVAASHIAFGGGTIRARTASGLEALDDQSFAPDEVETMLSAAGTGVHIGLFTLTEWHVSDMGTWGLREARTTATWPTSVGTGGSLRAPDAPVTKMMFRGTTDELDSIARAVAHAHPHIYVHLTAQMLEITPTRKHLALERLGSHLGIAPEECIAFGDTEADVPMLEQCGVGMLMDNADAGLEVHPRVQRTLSNDEDGVGMGLRLHFPTNAPLDV